jgi:rsbT antagonist protein RsbS
MQTYERIPIIRLWQILLVPLQGEVTDSLAEKLTSEILQRIHGEEVTGLVIDVTGLWLVDSHLCAVISRIAESAALMGARTFLSGMKPDVALTLETMGIELRGASSTRSLDEALEALGVRLVADDAPLELDESEGEDAMESI